MADEAYVADHGWERAVLVACPFHPDGGCGVSPHGSYPRVAPAGIRVARFYCPVARATISLLPSFLAARFSGTLDAIEGVVDAVEGAPSMAAAAEALRPADAARAVTSISAMRWVRRRVQRVRSALLALVTLYPDMLGCAPTLRAMRAHLGTDRVLVMLRALAAASMDALSPPLGLATRGRG
ncbi:MAG: hypothetical protein SangKO_097280 [Sandaracinaceae bacterium]